MNLYSICNQALKTSGCRLEVVLYLCTFLSLGTYGEQTYVKVALLLRLETPVYFGCDPEPILTFRCKNPYNPDYRFLHTVA